MKYSEHFYQAEFIQLKELPLRNCILEELLNVLNILKLFQKISNLLHCYYQVLLSSSTQLESSLPTCQLNPAAYPLYEHL